jgi:septum formation protein
MPPRVLILASASPRRSELLRLAGLTFTTRPVGLDETPLPGEDPAALAARLARAKVVALPAPGGLALILGADTVVTVAGKVLGKPVDEAEARSMLRLLAGRTHEVITAIAARATPEETIALDRSTSRVRFAPMTDDEIDWYAASGEGLDKAGGYALQGRGSLFVAAVEGSYTNVIGLPMERILPLLRGFGFRPALPPR